MSRRPAVECDEVTVSVGAGAARVTPLRMLTLKVDAGEAVAISGPSGSGKTTLLRLLAGELAADSGSVWVGGVPVAEAVTGRGVGMLYQDFRLVPFLSAVDNVSLAVEIRGRPSDAAVHASHLLRLLGLAGLEQRLPRELSGGQQQRVALARALSFQPGLVLADEPTAALDPHIAAGTVKAMIDATRSTRAALIIATHDPQVADTADRRLVLSDGRLVQTA